jgi:hypothetical protein
VAKAARGWIAAVGARTAYIEPGSPWENAYCESSNAKLRDELLNGEIFYSLVEARIVIERWRHPAIPSARTHHWATGRRPRRSCSGRLRHPDLLRRLPQP